MKFSFNFVYGHVIASKVYLTILYAEPFILLCNSFLFLAPIYVNFFNSSLFIPCVKDSGLKHGKECNGILPEEWSKFMPFDDQVILTIQMASFLLCILIRIVLYAWHMNFYSQTGTIHALEREIRTQPGMYIQIYTCI